MAQVPAPQPAMPLLADDALRMSVYIPTAAKTTEPTMLLANIPRSN